MWLPEQMPGIAILENPVEPVRFVPPHGTEIIADRVISGERHLVLASRSGRIRLCIREAPLRTVPAFIVELDAYAPRRFAAAAITDRVLHGRNTPMPKLTAPSEYQRHRLIQMLSIHDALNRGIAIREISFGLIAPRSRLLNAGEWRGSGERRHAHRLIAELRSIVDGGYRKLLLQG